MSDDSPPEVALEIYKWWEQLDGAGRSYWPSVVRAGGIVHPTVMECWRCMRRVEARKPGGDKPA